MKRIKNDIESNMKNSCGKIEKQLEDLKGIFNSVNEWQCLSPLLTNRSVNKNKNSQILPTLCFSN
jgi:hypothetical protein